MPLPRRRPPALPLLLRLLLPALLPALLLAGRVPLPGPRAVAAGEPATLRTEHYELGTEGPAAEREEWGRLLEAAWPQYEAWFGEAPRRREGERLRVVVTETPEAWSEAIRRAGGTPPAASGGVGGYYDPVSRGAYLYRQPSTWYTRTLLLHEAAHQFHYLAATGNRAPTAGWYVEGLAEHLSHHTWDGTVLRLGVVPLLSLEDRPAKALEAMAAPAFRLDALVRGDASPRPESMHLVRFLATGAEGRYARRFRTLAQKLDQGGSASALFARTFGPEPALLEALRAWLPSAQQPWSPLHVEWDPRGERALRGASAVVSGCRVRGPARRVDATWQPPPGAWRAGALLHVTDLSDWTVGLVDGGSVRVHRFTRGAWTALPASLPPAPAAGEPWRLVATREGTRVALRVNGASVGAWDLPGDALGLALDACTIDFTDLAWQ